MDGLLSFKHFILINFVYSCVLKYRGTKCRSPPPSFAVPGQGICWHHRGWLMQMAWARDNYCLFFCLIKFLFSSITLIYFWLLFL